MRLFNKVRYCYSLGLSELANKNLEKQKKKGSELFKLNSNKLEDRN